MNTDIWFYDHDRKWLVTPDDRETIDLSGLDQKNIDRLVNDLGPGIIDSREN